ncbi:hypothetical protein [Paracoccus pacificus]|uniref:Uncharacterized protein n=1 Tax=Paracoccus pacificus TaxID=1463598 RepID=A0ABW4R9M9_9RHOB
MRLGITVLAVSFVTVTPALASSDDAWAAFQAEVDQACRDLVQDPGDIAIEVNPFGSENFGAAIVTLTPQEGDPDRMICIYDKKEKKAELTAPFAPVELD